MVVPGFLGCYDLHTMPRPEYLYLVDLFSVETIDTNLILAEIDRRLEQVDANENVIERYDQREKLLELRDSVEAQHASEI